MPAPIVAALAPLLTGLFQNGLGMIAKAIQVKGKEVVEEKLGVKIPDDPAKLDPAKLYELQQAQFDHEEFLITSQLEEKRLDIDAEKHGQTQVSERWKFDMASDSWLSKNIRPLALAFLLSLLLGMVIADGAGLTFSPGIVGLVEMALTVVLSAYFVGRTLEKGVSKWRNGKK